MIKFNILTIFPEMFTDYLGSSLLGKAQEKKLVVFKLINIIPLRQIFVLKRESQIMNWKEFLKPDLRKIVITIILFIPSFFIVFFMCFPQGNFICDIFRLQFLILVPIFVILDLSQSLFVLVLQIISDIIFLYLLSCLIVWVYDKYKKK